VLRENVLVPTHPMQTLMLAAGIAMAFIGLLIARQTFGPRRLSVATRATIGLCMAIVGYHLIVWSYPPTLTPVQVGRQFWWAVLLAGVLTPVLSLWMDRFCLRSSGETGREEGGRDDLDSIR